jgi:predicted HicB family RNase H-like nuclease
MAKNKIDMFAGLKESVLNNTPQTPQQQVTPVKEKVKSDETPFTLYIPTETLKMLKIMAATEGKSIKALINEAIDEKYK